MKAIFHYKNDNKMKFKQVFPLFVLIFLIIGNIGCSTGEPDKKESVTTPEETTCSGTTTTFQGTIVDGSITSSAGTAVPLVEIETVPTISNINITDASGTFSVQVDCDAETYQFTAKKTGYQNRTIPAVANQDTVTVAFTMQRDTINFNFITITTMDIDTQGLLSGVSIGTASGGTAESFATNSSGQTSYPFPKSTAQSITISKTEYNPVVGSYSPFSGEFTTVSDGGGMVQTIGGQIFIKMKKTTP